MVAVQSLSHARLFATPWTVAQQAPLPMGFSRQEYWSRGAGRLSWEEEAQDWTEIRRPRRSSPPGGTPLSPCASGVSVLDKPRLTFPQRPSLSPSSPPPNPPSCPTPPSSVPHLRQAPGYSPLQPCGSRLSHPTRPRLSLPRWPHLPFRRPRLLHFLIPQQWAGLDRAGGWRWKQCTGLVLYLVGG